MVDDAFGAVAELAASQHGVLTGPQAAHFGITAPQLAAWVRRGWLQRLRRGIFLIAGTPPTWRTHLAAASLSSPHVAVSHRAAATLHRLDGASWPMLEVSTWRGTRCTLPRAVVHTTDSIDPIDTTFRDGIRVTTIARTLADIGAVVDDRLVVGMLDDAIRRGLTRRALERLITRIETRRALERLITRIDRPGPSGTAALRRALADRTAGEPDSWLERELLTVLRQGGLPEPVLHFLVRDDAGAVIAEADLAYPDHRLAIEGHSTTWHTGLLAETHDLVRHNGVSAAGWTTLYFSRLEVRRSPGRVVGSVAAALQRGTVAPTSLPASLPRQFQDVRVR